jgi:UTP--glucose-1-phosphate uridylyltransferase
VVSKIAQFQKRFKRIPRILELDHLTVTGDVNFGRNITLRGTVIGGLIPQTDAQNVELTSGSGSKRGPTYRYPRRMCVGES